MQKPRLSFWQLWNMSFGFLGIQFGFALQNANVSRIFETLGADPGNLALYWLAAPVTGLVVQPIIGYLSDRTWHPYWGRRRPFFFIGAILATIALFVMPNSPALWIAIGMLWIMDASINISMEPFRAFVGDKLPSEQRTAGFAMQSFFIGIGAVVASVLPYVFTNWLGISNEAPEGVIPDSVKYSFYIGAIAFIGAVCWTVFTTKEFPPEDMASFEKEKMQSAGFWKGVKEILAGFSNMPKTMIQLAWVQFFSWLALFAMWIYATPGVTSHMYNMKINSDQLAQLSAIYDGLDANDREDAAKYERIGEKLAYVAARLEQKDEMSLEVDFTNYFLSNRIIPEVAILATFEQALPQVDKSAVGYQAAADELAQLRVQLDELGTLEDRISYQTANFFITTHSDALPASVDLEKLALVNHLKMIQKEYNDGGNWVGNAFGMYNGIAALVAFLLPLLAGRIGRKKTHSFALLMGAVGLASIYLIKDPDLLLVSMIGVGIAWASILSMPYAILAGALPTDKMGYFMGVFNFFIVIPQIVAALILGFLISNFFWGEPIYALLLGGASMVLAALLVVNVDDVDEVVQTD